MNQRQPIKTPRNLRRHDTPSSLPPVLFSLPNLSEPTAATPVAPKPDPIATVSTRLPLVSPPNDPSHARRDERQKEKSASLLNAAIGFLALALVLIGAKLYSDRASESSRAAQRTNRTNNAENSVSPPPQTASTFQANPDRGIPDRGIITNVGPQRASYQVPLIPQPNPTVSESDPSKPLADPSDKPTLEISEPLSYQAESTQGPIQQAQFQSEALPLAPLPIAPLPIASLPVASMPVAPMNVAPMPNGSALRQGAVPKTASPPASPPAAFTPNVQNTIPAASLNTRDMIRLRQGKPVEMTNREPGSPSSVQLSGETYPPVRQKYEPLSLPQPQTHPTNSYNGEFLPRSPTSMEIPPPPTPYQPIGTEPTQ
jgi:hypothetical protein